MIFLRVVLGLLSLALFLQAVKRLFKDTSSQMTALALLAFYFTSPLLFTRPLIEGMCAPWLLLSAACCVAYQRHKQLGEILLALLCLTFATLIRYQSGLCLIPLIVCFFRERRWRHITATLAAATGLFILVGLWDQALKGNFHGSLVSYFAYNRAHSSSYGVSPFPTYIFLFLLLSFPVLGLTRLGERNWRALYSPLLAPLSYFSFFVLVHSFVLHKEERFMEPVMGLFLVLWTPLIDWTKSRWRLGPAIYLNALLLFLVSTTIPQKNVIGVARFVDGHTEIRRILGLKETLVVFPRAYIERIVPEERVDAIPLSLPCDTVLALRADLSDPERLTRYTRAGIFEPGLTERLIIHLNPAKNFRRATVELWRPRGCR
ncbi:MAG: hypothetical protein HYR96_01700 [Deltaproteobacteria bacterium]|nr:hypothetical protein [Deltaproteobacteria bacterium]